VVGVLVTTPATRSAIGRFLRLASSRYATSTRISMIGFAGLGTAVLRSARLARWVGGAVSEDAPSL
jgi:hypothetical protein